MFEWTEHCLVTPTVIVGKTEQDVAFQSMSQRHLGQSLFESLAFGHPQLSFQALFVEVALVDLVKLVVGSSFVVGSVVFVVATAAVASKGPAAAVA